MSGVKDCKHNHGGNDRIGKIGDVKKSSMFPYPWSAERLKPCKERVALINLIGC